jgi:hypothetical protein
MLIDNTSNEELIAKITELTENVFLEITKILVYRMTGLYAQVT